MCMCVGMRFSLGDRSYNGKSKLHNYLCHCKYVYVCMYVCTYMREIQWQHHPQLEYSNASDKEWTRRCCPMCAYSSDDTVLMIQGANWRSTWHCALMLCKPTSQWCMNVIMELIYAAT